MMYLGLSFSIKISREKWIKIGLDSHQYQDGTTRTSCQQRHQREGSAGHAQAVQHQSPEQARQCGGVSIITLAAPDCFENSEIPSQPSGPQPRPWLGQRFPLEPTIPDSESSPPGPAQETLARSRKLLSGESSLNKISQQQRGWSNTPPEKP